MTLIYIFILYDGYYISKLFVVKNEVAIKILRSNYWILLLTDHNLYQ